MTDVYSDAYWTTEFILTEADLDRIAIFIDSSGQAQPLGTLARRVVIGRLRHGPDRSTPIGQLSGSDTAVKQWDPAAEWKVGDHVTVLRTSEKKSIVAIGEIQEINLDERGPKFSRVTVFFAEEKETQGYGLLPANDPQRHNIVVKVKDKIADNREEFTGKSTDESDLETVEIVMFEYGERIIGPLLQALGEDDRFTRLDGRYFLQSLSIPPTAPQLHDLTWSLVRESDPLPTNDLLTRISNSDGDAALFGLYLAMRQHPQWFSNTQPGKRPLWKLTGPPPGSFTPQNAAYDPDSFEMLCLPEIEAPQEVVARLWATELLAAVV